MMKGKIYKIIHNQSNWCYVGSTFDELRYRWKKHKDNYKCWLKKGCYNNTKFSCWEFFKLNGIENFKIVLVKEYEVVDRRHLNALESLWIYKLKGCNKNNPFGITDTKLYQTWWNRQRWKNDNEYREKDRDRKRTEEYKKKEKEYKIKNKERIGEKTKEYYVKNAEKLKEKKKEWNEKNSNRHCCEKCDYQTWSKTRFDRHLTTIKHNS